MNNLRIVTGFLSQQDSLSANEFEKLYISLREKEGRIYSEEEIEKLPVVNSSHPLYKEWKIRKHSCDKLLNYIKEKRNVCNILEVGCGNGWLSAQLSAITTGEVIGVDINKVELKQARKVFQKKSNLSFLAGDIRNGILADKQFDLIVFAASAQYFKSLKGIIKTSLQYLTLQGEIHILDSPFYLPQEISSAKQRTKKYFSGLGFPGMSRFYFHRTLDELNSFNYTHLYNPNFWGNKLMRRKNPFYWIVIRNHYT